MIVRLLLALMLAFGAVPVAAMPAGCHDEAAMTTMAMTGGHATRHDHHPAVEHGCIGCAALPDWLAGRIAAPLLAAAADPVPIAAPFMLRAAVPPRLRPPRIG